MIMFTEKNFSKKRRNYRMRKKKEPQWMLRSELIKTPIIIAIKKKKSRIDNKDRKKKKKKEKNYLKACEEQIDPQPAVQYITRIM